MVGDDIGFPGNVVDGGFVATEELLQSVEGLGLDLGHRFEGPVVRVNVEGTATEDVVEGLDTEDCGLEL